MNVLRCLFVIGVKRAVQKGEIRRCMLKRKLIAYKNQKFVGSDTKCDFFFFARMGVCISLLFLEVILLL